ncbi:DUF7793 family protein [Arthrobacter sp.]|uniref:DUF7793 family protein n=1 Tax=Arthrobacter sp. TaxID=1667 RepID=UPI00281253DF|nr:hypothetical protein [Arthrobacter sp.]
MEYSSENAPRFELTDEGDFLRLCWNAGIVMELGDVQSSIAAVEAMSPSGQRPLLVHIDRVNGISAEARQLLLEETCSSRTAALGKDEVARVMTAFNYRAATLSEFFTDEAAAIAWLTQDQADAQDRTDEQAG